MELQGNNVTFILLSINIHTSTPFVKKYTRGSWAVVDQFTKFSFPFFRAGGEFGIP